MGIILIGLMIINVALLILSAVLLFTPMRYAFFVAFAPFMLIYIIIFFLFHAHTKKTLRAQAQSLIAFTVNGSASGNKHRKEIIFRRIGKKWVCEKNNELFFDLGGYLFQKSFIRAAIIRRLRYPMISGQKPISSLMRLRMKNNQIENLYLTFVDGKNAKTYNIVSNYVTKNSLLSSAITKSRYYTRYISSRFYHRYMTNIEKINETIFLSTLYRR